MAEQVVKPFKTLNRKFKIGDSVSPEDIHGVVSFDQWKERGFIGSPEVKVAPVDKWVPSPKANDAD